MLYKSRAPITIIMIKTFALVYFIIYFSGIANSNEIQQGLDTTRIPTKIKKTIKFFDNKEKARTMESFGNERIASTSENSDATPDTSKTVCTEVDPKTQCEIAIPCGSEEELEKFSLAEILGMGKANIIIPGQTCATFILDIDHPKTPWYCSGGICTLYGSGNSG